VFIHCWLRDKKFIRRWDSEHELSLWWHHTRTTNTIESWINFAIDQHGYVLERRFTIFIEITQCNGHYAVQGHTRSLILVPIESLYTTSYWWLILPYLLSCTVSKLWLIIGQIFASERGVPHFNALAGDSPLPVSPSGASFGGGGGAGGLWTPRIVKCKNFTLPASSNGSLYCSLLVYLQPLLRNPPESYQIRWNYAAAKDITPFKVIQGHPVCTNRKLTCNFLLVINTNLAPILHRFRDIAFDRSKIAIFGYPSCV